VGNPRPAPGRRLALDRFSQTAGLPPPCILRHNAKVMSDPGTQATFQSALQHHEAGRLREAEAEYRRVLLQDPRRHDVIQMLARLAHQSGKHVAAAALLRQAIAMAPRVAEYHSNLGMVLATSGQLNEAIVAFQQALALRPDVPEAHNNLANTLRAQKRLDDAVAAYRKAVELRPAYVEARLNLAGVLREKGELNQAIAEYRNVTVLRPGDADLHYQLATALNDQGNLEEAIAVYRQVLAIRPDFAEVLSNLGNALRQKGEYQAAMDALRQALALKPALAEAHNNLGSLFLEDGQIDQAITAYRQAALLRPDIAEAHSNLGNALQEKGQLDEAMAAFHRALTVNSDLPEAHNNIGNVLWERGDLNDATVAYRRALAARPNYAKARMNLGMMMLTQGDFTDGWPLYEARLELAPTWARRKFPQPCWDGGDLAGRTILLHAEQGFGDTIQFIRYAPMVQRRGGRVILGCPPELRRLLAGQCGIEEPVTDPQSLPPFDVHCPLPSLPGVFGTTLDTIPADVPYLFADKALVEKWRAQFGNETRIKVGLAWAGNPKHKNDRNRSISLAALVPLAQTPGIAFYSLQKGVDWRQNQLWPGEPSKRERQGEAPAEPPPWLTDWTEELSDFADTAALIANLDLVIAVDTAVAHLAGALGKPVWLLLSYAVDWRWMSSRSDSPWYPTLRLFRQTRWRDWDDVIQRVANDVKIWTGS